MKRVFRILVVTVLTLGLSGCLLGSTLNSGAKRGPPKSRMNVTLLWGLKPTRVDSECPAGIATAATFIPLWGGVVAWFSFGAVVPTMTVYTCATQ